MIYFLVCVHNLTHNSKYTNFTETNNKTNKISTYNEDDVRKEELTKFLVVYSKGWLYGVTFVICWLLLRYCW